MAWPRTKSGTLSKISGYWDAKPSLGRATVQHGNQALDAAFMAQNSTEFLAQCHGHTDTFDEEVENFVCTLALSSPPVGKNRARLGSGYLGPNENITLAHRPYAGHLKLA